MPLVIVIFVFGDVVGDDKEGRRDGVEFRVGPGGNCIIIGLPGKSIFREYFQENMASQRPFLLQRICFPGGPFFIQLIPESLPRSDMQLEGHGGQEGGLVQRPGALEIFQRHPESRHPFSKACLQHSQTVLQPCIVVSSWWNRLVSVLFGPWRTGLPPP